MPALPDAKERSVLGLGEWERRDARIDDEFAADLLYSEPHLFRRRTILKKCPQVALLYGTAIETLYVTVLMTACQLLLAYYFGVRLPQHFDGTSNDFMYWALFGATAMAIGGSLTALVGVIVHETCHNLVHPDPMVNRITGLIANVPMLVPVAASFKRYHLEHHTWQGVEGKDPDLPLRWEIWLIRGNPLLKVIWVFFYPAMYAVRGFAQGRTISDWERANAAFMVVVDFIVWRTCGSLGIAYLAASLWFGYSFHPAAAHFIQEHYTFASKQETYSYYGWMNSLFMNIGLHNEHHDFVQIPWTRIWALYYVAEEFYKPLAAFDSWFTVHWRFIIDQTLGPVSRVARTLEVHRKDRKVNKFC